jgi:hypothetical protein
MSDQMGSNMFLVTITVTDFLLGRSTFSNQTLQDASEYTQQEIRHCDCDYKHIGTQVYHSLLKQLLKVEKSAMPQQEAGPC